MTLPILYSFRRCPYAMRARLALVASETRCALREVLLADKPAELLAASAKATVPVLVLEDGRVIDESLAIMRWCLAHHDPRRWLAYDDPHLRDASDGPFKQALDRYKYPQRYGSEAAAHRAVGLAFLHVLETRLANTPQLCGAQPGLTDMAIVPFVRQFAKVDPQWFAAQSLPGVQSWLARHVASALFAAMMIRAPRWHPGDAPIILGAPA